MTINHRPEHGTGPSDAQLLDYLRRGAVHTPDGTVIGWVPPTPAIGTGSLTYNDVDGLACRECGTDLLRPGEGDALPWREIRGIIDSHTASQHQAHSGIHPLPEYEPPAHPHTSTSPFSTHEPDPTRAELIAFLRARLDEDEQTALPFCDPARVLADIAAKRRMIDLFVEYDRGSDQVGDVSTPGLPSWLAGNAAALDTVLLLLLAQPYADHPHFKTEWRMS